MRHDEDEMRRKGVLRDGERMRVPAMMMDSKAIDPGRVTLADIATMGAMPPTTPKVYEAELQPIAEALRSISSKERATEIMHMIEITHTRIKTRLDSEMQMASSGMYGPNGEAETRERQKGARDVLAWMEAVHQTIQGATVGLRDQMMKDMQDRAAGARAVAFADYLDHLNNAHRNAK